MWHLPSRLRPGYHSPSQDFVHIHVLPTSPNIQSYPSHQYRYHTVQGKLASTFLVACISWFVSDQDWVICVCVFVCGYFNWYACNIRTFGSLLYINTVLHIKLINIKIFNSKFVPVCVTKANGGNEAWLFSFLTLVLNEVAWPASHCGCFTPVPNCFVYPIAFSGCLG